MKNNLRLNPNITTDSKTIFDGLIRLEEAALFKSISISGYKEVFTVPLKNQFSVMYFYDDLKRKVGVYLQFNPDNEGETLTIQYYGCGSPITAEDWNDIINQINSLILSPDGTIKINSNNINTYVTMNVKWYGAMGDGLNHPLSDKFTSLQDAQLIYPKAVSLTDEIDWCAIQKSLDTQNTTFIPNGSYIVNRTLNQRFDTLLIGEGMKSTKIYTYGNTSGWFLIVGNSGSSDSNYNYLGSKIKDIYVEPQGTQADTGSYGIYLNGSADLENLYFYRMKSFVYKPATYYMDMLNIRRCRATFMDYNPNGDCPVAVLGSGDAMSIQECCFSPSTTRSNSDPTKLYDLVQVEGTNGCKIKNCIINGNIRINDAINTDIETLHTEGQSAIYIDHSHVNIRTAQLWSYPNFTNIVITDSVNSGTVVELENIDFTRPDAYTTADPFISGEPMEISITGQNTDVVIKNCYRQLDIFSSPKPTTIVGIKTNIDLFNKHSNIFSRYSRIVSGQVMGLSQLDFTAQKITTSFDPFYGCSLSANTWYKSVDTSAITYYYRPFALLDDTRKIILAKGSERSVSGVIYNGQGVRLLYKSDADREKYTFTKLLIFRGKNPDTYDEKIILPLTLGRYMYDYGTSINGYQWGSISTYAAPLTDYNVVDGMKYINGSYNNVEVYMAAPPTVGTWNIGDKVINNTPISGSYAGWLYISGGVWKGYGLIQS